MKGLEGCGWAEGRTGQSVRIEEYAGTAAALHHKQTHMLWRHTSEKHGGVGGGTHANAEHTARYSFTSLNYAIDLYQRHVKDNV